MPRRKPAHKPSSAPKILPKASTLLAWYDKYHRRLPWRSPPGKPADPYVVWLSEIMLQQTTVTAVRPYFEAFFSRWPSVEKLAEAEVEAVMTAWAGLGYYARARNLHKCAGIVAREFDGKFPDKQEELLKLPGIGPYTASAITSIAFQKYAVVMDGNVERVMARVFAVADPLPKSKAKLSEFARSLTPKKRPGDYAQAVMDLGATVCIPKSPRCNLCPWSDNCAGLAQGIAVTLPKKQTKTERPMRTGQAFWMVRKDGCVLLRRRPNRGLLGGMTEVPCSAWDSKPSTTTQSTDSYGQNSSLELSNTKISCEAPLLKARWKLIPGTISHTFTHFHLELSVVGANLTPAQARSLDGPEAIWTPVEKIGRVGLPSVMRKVAQHAIKGMG
ncbi:MAG TPA: A/G-specific adenine glycosylase [Rhodospirillaceae bacterium]|nr:A/G-specific adenine glycosylase [Candidatus Neomarinimicrobiota bacterium]HCX14096.1 A/G-specific adenine glycosylase [Rhodospirillaceae bacterium]